jgi:hypothetical protein
MIYGTTFLVAAAFVFLWIARMTLPSEDRLRKLFDRLIEIASIAVLVGLCYSLIQAIVDAQLGPSIGHSVIALRRAEINYRSG